MGEFPKTAASRVMFQLTERRTSAVGLTSLSAERDVMGGTPARYLMQVRRDYLSACVWAVCIRLAAPTVQAATAFALPDTWLFWPTTFIPWVSWFSRSFVPATSTWSPPAGL